MESIFDLEVRDKKAISKSQRAKTNGRRKSGHMLPMDFMTTSEKKEYSKGGEITVTNLWDQILTLSQYQELSDEKKKMAMEHWRKVHSANAIRKTFGWAQATLYAEFKRIGVEVRKIKPRAAKVNTTGTKTPAIKAPQIEPLPQPAADLPEIVQLPQIVQMNLETPQGSCFYVNELFSAEEAIGKLMKIASFLEGEKHNFKIRLEVQEIKA